ncbi:nucleotidyltransferase domain-containing protein [Candidatus Sumerlaeota bacterium]|nr:nucleotidyltransferase domain-containing protein [Candidatus Sumerlaeota bacterium]
MKSNKPQFIDSSDLISQMIRRIVETVSPERIILFGSYANGMETPDSDIDLMVIESGEFGPERSRRKEMARLWLALKDFAFPKDILVYTNDEWEKWRESQNHIIARASREGRALYERKHPRC